MPHTYGDLVEPDRAVPDFVLAHPQCPAPIREAAATLDAANEATAAERAKVTAIHDEAEDNARAIRQAIAAGKEVRASIPAEVTEERVRVAEAQVRAAVNRARQAAKVYEDGILPHRAQLRAIYAERLPQAAAEAAQKLAEMRAAADEARKLAGMMQGLDYAVSWEARNVRPLDRAAVEQHYEAAARRDPLNAPRREARLSLAWDDVTAYATGVQVDAILPDPLKGA